MKFFAAFATGMLVTLGIVDVMLHLYAWAGFMFIMAAFDVWCYGNMTEDNHGAE